MNYDQLYSLIVGFYKLAAPEFLSEKEKNDYFSLEEIEDFVKDIDVNIIDLQNNISKLISRTRIISGSISAPITLINNLKSRKNKQKLSDISQEMHDEILFNAENETSQKLNNCFKDATLYICEIPEIIKNIIVSLPFLDFNLAPENLNINKIRWLNTTEDNWKEKIDFKKLIRLEAYLDLLPDMDTSLQAQTISLKRDCERVISSIDKNKNNDQFSILALKSYFSNRVMASIYKVLNNLIDQLSEWKQIYILLENPKVANYFDMAIRNMQDYISSMEPYANFENANTSVDTGEEKYYEWLREQMSQKQIQPEYHEDEIYEELPEGENQEDYFGNRKFHIDSETQLELLGGPEDMRQSRKGKKKEFKDENGIIWHEENRK